MQNASLEKQKMVTPSLKVPGVEFHRFFTVKEDRGCLSFGEFERQIPFNPKRYFFVYNVPAEEVRGQHAHHNCHQFLIAAHGTLEVIVDDGSKQEKYVLSDPGEGLYLPPKIWGVQQKFSSEAVLLVFASDFYEEEDYIRNYEMFKEIRSVE